MNFLVESISAGRVRLLVEVIKQHSISNNILVIESFTDFNNQSFIVHVDSSIRNDPYGI